MLPKLCKLCGRRWVEEVTLWTTAVSRLNEGWSELQRNNPCLTYLFVFLPLLVVWVVPAWGTWNIRNNIECCYLQSYMSCSTCEWIKYISSPFTNGTHTHTFISALDLHWFSLSVELGRDITDSLLENSTNQLQDWEQGYLIYTLSPDTTQMQYI